MTQPLRRGARRVAPSLALFLILLAAPAFGQEEAAPPAEAPPPDAAAAENAAPAEGDATAVPTDNEVALNLNKVNIDKILSFLSELTGKPVFKHKEAKAEITVATKQKVPKDEAIRLIVDALRMEKVYTYEREGVIWLVPESALAEMQVNLAETPEQVPSVGLVSKAIPVRFADVKEIEALVRPLLSKNAGVVSYPGAKKIIVTDTIDRIDNLERVMAQLDVLDIDARQVQIFQLEHADAEELAPILKTILGGDSGNGKSKPGGGKSSGGPGGGKGEPPSEGGPAGGAASGGSNSGASEIEVIAYKAANWLVVVAPKERFEQVTQLIEEFDREAAQELRLRTIPLKYTAADDLAQRLSALLQKRQQKRLRDMMEVTADRRSNSLIVLSTEANFESIRRIAESLDKSDSVQTKTEWIELKHADAEDLAEQMNDLYTGTDQRSFPWYYGGGSRRQSDEARTRFVAETRTNSLIAIAPPSEFERIYEVVERLDRPIEHEEATPRIFPIRNNDAKELADVLGRVFGTGEQKRTGGYYDWIFSRGSTDKQVGRLYGKVHFEPLLATNSLVVTTNSTENFPIVEKFIRDLDSSGPESANLLVVTLKNARAEDISEQLNVLFAREGARAPEKKTEGQEREAYYSFLFGDPKKKDERAISDLIGQVRVVPDTRTNSLVITTLIQHHDAIRKLIEQMDVPSPKVYVSVRLIEIIRSRSSRIGARVASDASVFETDDFDNGLRSALGFSWAEVHGNGVISADVSIQALVQFLIRHFNSRILSDTSLSMNNNKEASIFVGSEIPFIDKSLFTPEGGRSDSFIYRDAGTELKITPNINTDGKVVMNIALTSTQIREGQLVLGAFILDTRKFNTMLAVESGESIVMGGILREQETETVRRVPILGYIPLLNLIFRKKDTKNEVTELVAFITPIVLRTPADDEAVTSARMEELRGRDKGSNLPANPADPIKLH